MYFDTKSYLKNNRNHTDKQDCRGHGIIWINNPYQNLYFNRFLLDYYFILFYFIFIQIKTCSRLNFELQVFHINLLNQTM